MRLDDVTVLDMTRLLPGPYATQLLADLGAEVIKVEPPEGDYARWMPPTTDDGVGAVFDAVNRGKKSVALDLKVEAAREAFYALAADADVVFESFRPGVVERLGVDHERLREHNPGLVYCSLSGYGGDGPYRDRVGHDLNYVGVAGLLDMTRADEAEAPRIPGYPIGDMAGGLFAAFAILGGLLSRELGSGGEHLDVSMTDAVVSFSQAVAPGALAGEDPRPGGTPLTGGYPWYDVYETADGGYVTLAALEPQFWAAFCEAVGREELVDAHMTTEPAELSALRAELAELFAGRDREAWEELLGDVDAAFGVVNRPAEAFAHEQLRDRGMVVESGDRPPRVGLPFGASGGLREPTAAPPALGEHTEAELSARGVDVAALREAGGVPDGV